MSKDEIPEQFKNLEKVLCEFLISIQRDRELNMFHANIDKPYTDYLDKLSSILGTVRLETETLLGKALRERSARSTYGEMRYYTVRRTDFYSCLDWLNQGIEGPWSGLDFAKNNCERRNKYEESKGRKGDWIVIYYDFKSNSFAEVKD